MIRNIEEKDMSLINELTTIVRYDIDFAHSAINFDENGKVKALVLTSEKPSAITTSSSRVTNTHS